jgi:hypothetical protein
MRNPPDLDLAQQQALASHWDYPEDFGKPTTWNWCERYIKPVIAIARRIQCWDCAGHARR